MIKNFILFLSSRQLCAARELKSGGNKGGLKVLKGPEKLVAFC